MLTLLPDEITEDLAQALFSDVVRQREEAIAAQSKVEPESMWSLIEEGRNRAFSVLWSDASAFLIPGRLLADQGASLL